MYLSLIEDMISPVWEEDSDTMLYSEVLESGWLPQTFAQLYLTQQQDQLSWKCSGAFLHPKID